MLKPSPRSCARPALGFHLAKARWCIGALAALSVACGADSADPASSEATGGLGAAPLPPTESPLPQADGVADGVADLKETLVAGLRATRPEEIAWIDQVVEKVGQGRLPLPLVLSTFKWARNRHPSYPFPYFKRGLRVRAARLGIPL